MSQVALKTLVDRSEEVVFAGDEVRLAGQIDYPLPSPYQSTFPLLFMLHHAGCDDREGYQHLADVALNAGYAVFRWDKRGTGRSGSGGGGSTVQDAVNAYELALDQKQIDRRHTVIMAQDAGSGLLGDSFGLFARAQHPAGVALISNLLDESAVCAIDSRLLILMGQQDWNPWEQYGRAAAEAHNAANRHGAEYFVAPYADRSLTDMRYGTFHAGARGVLDEWLRSII
jgi:alpha-beta hydrolase superfamily lysophospholipase